MSSNLNIYPASPIAYSPTATVTVNGSNSSFVCTGSANFKSEVIIQGVDISKSIQEINKRLCILNPNLDKIEHFPALKKAYDQYKLIESMLNMEDTK